MENEKVIGVFILFSILVVNAKFCLFHNNKNMDISYLKKKSLIDVETNSDSKR